MTPLRPLLALALAAGPVAADELPEPVEAVLRKHCFECHGKDPAKPKAKLNLFDPAGRARVVEPGKPAASELIARVTATDDTVMPPDDRPKLSDADKKALADWVAALPAAATVPVKVAVADPDRPARVKEVFRAKCFECHGGAKTNAGVRVFDRDGLVAKKKLAPGKPDESVLFQLVTAPDASVMPPTGQPGLSADEVETIRKWISDGAPALPADAARPAEAGGKGLENLVGVEYVLTQILEYVRKLPADDRRYVRFFSINHLLTGGATAAELDLHRDALAKAVNHLSNEPRIVRPKPVDPAATLFAVDLRDLGWHQQPYSVFAGKTVSRKSSMTVFDIALLEYPYAILYEDAEIYDRVRDEYILPAEMARPVAYVRADWFCSVVTQPPFYEDFLKLPFTLQELETKLGVDTSANLRDGRAKRAGVTVSGVSRNNRVVERHPAGGGYWKSFDFRTSRGPENMFKDPLDFQFSGGEMIFPLPNGLQAYYVADAQGNRIEAAPTEIVTDKFASDKTVRNGLACMRCHDRGMKGFVDNVRPAVEKLPGTSGLDKRLIAQVYPKQEEMDAFLKEDGDRFLAAMEKALGRPRAREPLIPVSKRYLDDPIHLGTAAGELGLADPKGLAAAFRTPQAAALGLIPLASQDVIRRDAWEEYFDQAVRLLGLGVPVVPLDGVARRDYPAGPAAVEVELKTNARGNLFKPGDQMTVSVANRSAKRIYIELVGTSTTGRKVVVAPSSTQVEPGRTFSLPPIPMSAKLGKEQVTLLASFDPFPAGEVLRGAGVTDRVVRPLYQYRRVDGRTQLGFDPARMVKRTIDVETR